MTTTDTPPIIEACVRGDLPAVQSILAEDRAQVFARDRRVDSTPLHFASHRGYADIVRELLNARADVNAREGCSGATPLHWAAEGGHDETAAVLVDAGANLFAVDDWYALTPIDWTAVVVHASKRHHNRDATARVLMERGARPSLFRAIARDDQAGVREALRSVSAMPTARAALQSLVPAPPDLVRRLGPAMSGMMPLHLAAWRGDGGIAALLAARGAPLGAATSLGHSALSLAALRQHADAQLALERAGAAPDVPTFLARQQFAAAEKYVLSDPQLLQRGGAHYRVLLSFAEHGRADVVEWLVTHGADLNATDTYLGVDEWMDELTALHLASRRGHLATVQVLIEGGADVNTYSPRSHITPLHLAAVGGHTEVARVLVAAGADANVCDATHEAPAIGWAAYAKRDETVEFLRSVTRAQYGGDG